MEMDLESSRRSAAFASSFVEEGALEISVREHVGEDVRHHDGMISQAVAWSSPLL
jgi:hypothetical protein